MPIGIDRFEDDDALDESTTSERIVRFLLENADRAYTRGEIATEIDSKPETVGTNLSRLKDHGLVRHREPYWALTDDRERAIDTLDARDGDGSRTVRVEGDRNGTPPASNGPHREAATAFFERARDRLEDAVEALYLFGSIARDAETATSDVDILAVVANDADFAAVDDRLLDLAYAVQLEYEVPVEVHAVRASEFATRKEDGDPFVRTVLEEGERRV